MDRNDEQSVWIEYERRKSELRDQGLTMREYELAVRKLADELGV